MLAQICGAKLNFLYVANINQLAINAVLSDAILDSVTKAGNVDPDRALEMVPAGIEKESFSDTDHRRWLFSTLQRQTILISLSWGVVGSVL